MGKVMVIGYNEGLLGVLTSGYADEGLVALVGDADKASAFPSLASGVVQHRRAALFSTGKRRCSALASGVVD